ncbi:hypothetical protein FOZG_17333 [Fusarium oxysporum Fo47]|uniref:SET domain-containing protein n=1 Tax=Fusarium oxysporum Fo47 TaxID=660027 RepID=W9JEZ7_FUSOX|nr:hypothetical protein FOZG_17333 [Fusarium oxysporum Fo47]
MDHVREALQGDFFDQVSRALSDYALDELSNPILCVHVFVRDRSDASDGNDTSKADGWRHSSELLLSHQVDLASSTAPQPPCSPTSASSTSPRTSRRSEPPPATAPATDAARRVTKATALALPRKRQSGLRPAPRSTVVVDDGLDSRRQMQVGDENFPKRAKIKPDGVFYARESSLSKFIVGVWEQIHSGLILDPHVLTEQVQLTAATATCTTAMPTPQTFACDTQRSQGTPPASLGITVGIQSRSGITYDFFSRSNLFCRRVTQASRTCRSIEVIVQARWVELFDSYVEYLSCTNPGMSSTKSRMRALTEACNDFGWSEKELRNKMAIWRGYKEIKDILGWVALVFSGMGLYRLCKYRIDFDKEKFQRVRALRLRMEVAADTLHQNWRQILAIVGESTQQRFSGHPHDWVVYQDGFDPIPLRSTYLENDPNFSFEHLEESVLDTTSWGADDPRWIPPLNAIACVTDTNICDVCGQAQSNDATLNSCKCFPSLFGGPRLPCPVQVFRTPNGRNNGIQALLPFERGIAIGEFVGLVTKNMEDQDVLDSKAGGRRYQIWQGRQGNFTRFMNHSCKPNAQFQKFVWLGTQHILLTTPEVIGMG